MSKVLSKSLKWYQVNPWTSFNCSVHSFTSLCSTGFLGEKRKEWDFQCWGKCHIPNLTVANQLLFHLENGQGFLSPKIYTFSIPYKAKTTHIAKKAWFPEKATMHGHFRKPSKLTFCPSQKKPYPESMKRTPRCVLPWKSIRRQGFYSQIYQSLAIPISILKITEYDRLKWNNTNESTLHLNRALWFATYFT